MSTILHEPARQTPIVTEVDCCIIGGSCTGVFAALRAAEQGLSVALVELHNQFGGVATTRMVNVWHSLWNTTGDEQIIGGLTEAVMRRLQGRGAVIERSERNNPDWQFCFNPAELATELDEMVSAEPRIRPFLHCRMVAATLGDDQRISHIVVEDKSGRRAIACRAVIDASGDADVLRRLGMATRTPSDCQPPTMAAIIEGITELKQRLPDFNMRNIIFNPEHPKALRQGFCGMRHCPVARPSAWFSAPGYMAPTAVTLTN